MDGNTIRQGYTARGRTHFGGIFMGAIGTQKVLNPPVTSQLGTGQPVTDQPGTGQPITCQPLTGQDFTGQPGTGQPGTDHLIPGISHWSSSHRSLESDYQAAVTWHRAFYHQSASYLSTSHQARFHWSTRHRPTRCRSTRH